MGQGRRQPGLGSQAIPRPVDNREPTKRDVVRITSKIYDPVGFITPLTVRLKLFCQSLCQKRLDWDEALDEQSKTV